MEPKIESDEDKVVLNSYTQFGTYYIAFLGTVIANHIHDHFKHKETRLVEPIEA